MSPRRTSYTPLPHVVMPGQVYQSCTVREGVAPARIQVAAAAVEGRAPVVDARTGRPRRPVTVTSLFSTTYTRTGSDRRTGWVLLPANEYIGDYLSHALHAAGVMPDYPRGCSISDDPRVGGYVLLGSAEGLEPAVHALETVGWFGEDACNPEGWVELRVRFAGSALCPSTMRNGGGWLVCAQQRGHGDAVDHWDPVGRQHWSG